MDKAINAIPKDQGELKDLAMGLRSYIRDPQEEGQAVRGMLFAQYLGGSLASAFVNMTQPFQVTLPWLSQYGGMKKAGAQLARALKDMGTKGFQYEADLAKACSLPKTMAWSAPGNPPADVAGPRRGRCARAMGRLQGMLEQRLPMHGSAPRWPGVSPLPWPSSSTAAAPLLPLTVWQRSRAFRTLCIRAQGGAGYAVCLFQGSETAMGTGHHRGHAVHLQDLQRVLSGADAAHVEQGGKEGKRAVGWSIAMLMLMGGAGGLPFAEDIEDLIDAGGQLMGYSMSVKQWRKQLMQDVLGKELADFIEQGVGSAWRAGGHFRTAGHGQPHPRYRPVPREARPQPGHAGDHRPGG
jgi:hypothetical protein